VGELKDRRARKKAQTRELIRSVAQGLFAERGFDDVTIADVAARADVAVQTVFNHFTTKEELFFDGRVPWVTGPASAVRDREPGVAPLLALRGYLIDTVTGLVSSMACPERRCYLATLEASEALRARERELIHECERLLAGALLEVWSEPDAVEVPADPQTAAPLTAAVWLAAARVMVLEQRPLVTEGLEPDRAAAAVQVFAERLLAQMETSLELINGLTAPLPRTDTGWPDVSVLRAG
jgi:AcrR family transcriptional regulator